MKKIIILLIFPISIFAQNSLPDSIIKAKTKISLDFIKNNIKAVQEYDNPEYDYSESENSEYSNGESNNYKSNENKISFSEIKSIMTCDVIEYFKLKKVYDTELKKVSFKSTQEYKDKYKELLSIQSNFKKSIVLLDLSDEKIRDYDLSLKGFYISTKKKSHYLITPFFQTAKNGWGDTFIFISVNQENALKIENNRDKLKMLLIFRPEKCIIKKETMQMIFNSVQPEYLTTNYARFLIINNDTDEIYFDKNYSVNKKK